MYLSVLSFFEKYVFTVQCIHNAWKWTYIMVIGNCHSRMSNMWQYLISSQVLYGSTLNIEFSFYNRSWHAVALRYKRNLLSCIWIILIHWKLSCPVHNKCPVHDRNSLDHVMTVYWHIMVFLTQLNIFFLYLETI